MLTERDIAVMRVLEKGGAAAAREFVQEPVTEPHAIWRESCEKFVKSSKQFWMVWLALWTLYCPSRSPSPFPYE